MNYYEELGIRQDAALEEIRQAYKVLARLLHPDGQPDARLKAMAECQMKRLNEILAILTDSQKRRLYDESLRESPKAAMEWAPPPPVPQAYWYYQVLHFGLRHWFWILIGLAVAGVGLWCIQQGAPEAAQVAPKHNEAVPDAPGASGPSTAAPPPQSSGNAIKPAPPPPVSTAPREAPRPIVRQSAVGDAAAAEANPAEPVRSSPAKEPPAPNPIAIAEPPRVAVEAPKVEPPRAAFRASEASFAGNWFYAPETGSKPDPNLYPATYVEFILADENGSLVGNYRAKYRIPDQAISPEVQFRVQGKSANAKSCKLAWTSDDGAQGEAELTLRSSNQMNVTWWTTVFGRRAALSSGVAVLIRQQAP
ncbi:MAG: DnaJ domain-containing protein [Bryobacteraceae bacterium]|jgi:curved DNA-binding protein CbpA